MNKSINRTAAVALVSCGVLTACGGSGSSGNDTSVTPGPDSPNDVSMVTFDFADFTEIEILGPFEVWLDHGTDHSVQLTVDSDIVNSLNVEQQGSRLTIGFRSGINVQSQTLEAVITLPSLTFLRIAGATRATLFEFEGSFIEVHAEGAATLDAINVTYDFLTLRALGAAQVSWVNATALPSADVMLDGASVATLNMMVASTLTGSINAASRLLYYGSNLSLLINTFFASIVERLGDTLD